MSKIVLLLLVLPLLLLTFDQLQSPVSAIEDTSLNGWVPNVIGQFKDLKHHGEALGFNLGDAPDATMHAHYQGIQRSTQSGTPCFYVSQCGKYLGGDKPAMVHVVKLASRDEPLMVQGERLRSNRLSMGTKTEDTPPPENDKIVYTVAFDGHGVWPNDWPNYAHAGGMQLIDDVLVVPLSDPLDPGFAPSKIAFLDVKDQTSPPSLLYQRPVEPDASWGGGQSVGVVAITRLPNGRFLMLYTGNYNKAIVMMESNVADLRDPNLAFDYTGRWESSELKGGEWPTGSLGDVADGYQTMNFVWQSDGALFLIGTRSTEFPTSWLTNEDWAELYQVDYSSPEPGWFGELSLTFIDSKQFHCRYDGAGLIGNFRAAAGVYISPSGELILYATEHENDGPNDSVRMGEFRHKRVNRPDSPLRRPTADAGGPYFVAEGSSVVLSAAGSTPPPEKPWVELFEDPDFKGRSIIYDWEDTWEDDFDNFDKLDDFDNRASSVRWQAPVGCDVHLWSEPGFKGGPQKLLGAGIVGEISDLDDKDFDDKVSSIAFSNWGDTGDATLMAFGWDLDNDGWYDDVSDREAGFSAANLDDGTYYVGLIVGGAYTLDDVTSTTITVLNVPPTATIDSLIQPNSHFILPIVHTLTFTGSFTDPGALDTHTATWDFGDGTVVSGTLTEENIAPNSTGVTTANHAYSNPGNYTVILTVTDDDGGVGTDTMQVTVLSAEEAREVLHQYIQGLAGSAFKDNPSQRKKAFSNVFAAISDMLEDEEWNGAITDLISNVRAKADGFVDGNPQNDWIRDPVAQQEICLMVDDIVAYLKTFL